jgi:hypothetical protein
MVRRPDGFRERPLLPAPGHAGAYPAAARSAARTSRLLARLLPGPFAPGELGTAADGLDAGERSANGSRRYDWPGNVRELRNLIHRVAVLDPAEVIEPPHLGLPSEARPAGGRWVDEVIGMRLEDISREVTLATLRHVNGNRTAAAGLLGVTDRTIRNKLRAWKEDGLDESALLAGAGRAS